MLRNKMKIQVDSASGKPILNQNGSLSDLDKKKLSLGHLTAYKNLPTKMRNVNASVLGSRGRMMQ